MTLKQWDDRELAKVSADLDAELEQLFDEMETVLTSPAEEGPRLEFLPDDEEPEPASNRRQGNEDQPLPRRHHLPTEEDYQHYASEPDEDRPEAQTPPPSRPQQKQAGPASAPQKKHDLPEAEVLPDDHPVPPQILRPTVASLSPDEFSRLMERAVARGVMAALKKWKRHPQE